METVAPQAPSLWHDKEGGENVPPPIPLTTDPFTPVAADPQFYNKHSSEKLKVAVMLDVIIFAFSILHSQFSIPLMPNPNDPIPDPHPEPPPPPDVPQALRKKMAGHHPENKPVPQSISVYFCVITVRV